MKLFIVIIILFKYISNTISKKKRKNQEASAYIHTTDSTGYGKFPMIKLMSIETEKVTILQLAEWD